jgi:hypothetical protein
MLAFVSTTPSRGGFPILLFAVLAFVLVLELSAALHPASETAPINTNASASLCRIVLCSASRWTLFELLTLDHHA